MLNKFPFMTAQSSVPGAELKQIDFSYYGEKRVPFKGGLFTVLPGATSRPDTHKVSECWMIVTGTGTLNYDDKEYSVSAGDCLFFESEKTHFIFNNGTEEIKIYTVWWME